MQVIKNNTTLLVSLLSAYLIFLVISVANDLIAFVVKHVNRMQLDYQDTVSESEKA